MKGRLGSGQPNGQQCGQQCMWSTVHVVNSACGQQHAVNTCGQQQVVSTCGQQVNSAAGGRHFVEQDRGQASSRPSFAWDSGQWLQSSRAPR